MREKDLQPIVLDLKLAEYKNIKRAADLQDTTITKLIYAMVKEYIEDIEELEEMEQ
jgi:hypothetical protein